MILWEGSFVIKKLYPQGKKKAFNITYDDGVLQDVRFVAMLNQYSLKGTFNLNSELMWQGFSWTHECGMEVKRLPQHVVVDLYRGHEVASHTLTHPYMHDLSEHEIMYQLGQDKANLEWIFGCRIHGFAVPFTYYSPLIADCARRVGFTYARMSEERYTYAPPEDDYYWAAGAFHISPGFTDFVNGFWETEEELALCQIVGHSYDLDAEDMWEQMEEICSCVAESPDIVSMTNLELVLYLRAIRSCEISDQGIWNPSEEEVWFEVNGHTIMVSPGTYVSLH